MKTYKRQGFLIFLFLLTLYFSLSNCSNTPKPLKAGQEGELLAKKHCNTCHKYPEPALVDKESWEKHILPAMAQRMGIKVYAEDMYVNDPSSNSLVSYDDWMKIVQFYTKTAPKVIKPAVAAIKPVKDWAVFKLKKPVNSVPIATTTLVAFDTISNSIITSDMENKKVYQWSDNLKLLSGTQFSSSAVDVQFKKNANEAEHATLTFIGSLDAVDIANGYLTDFELQHINSNAAKANIASNLRRAIESVPGDFNKDGLTDWLVCEFGHNIGGLSVYTQLPGNHYQKKVIRAVAGPTHAVTGDYNNDGWEDIICLFAHADEGIWMFLNDHKGGFITKNLMRFPPVYGSSSFQLVDFNKDGKLDILYTSGDNSDYSKVLKPFHGVYIFLNQGDFKFKQAYFYPINGATKAIATDFNKDGKLDIAVIAFFSDLKNNPAEGFTYFEQTKPMQFIPYNIPIQAEGRWICMDVKDYNKDGKPDVVLGNFSLGFINQDSVKHTWNSTTPFIVLENKTK